MSFLEKWRCSWLDRHASGSHSLWNSLFSFEPSDDQKMLYKLCPLQSFVSRQHGLWLQNYNLLCKLYIILHVLLQPNKGLCIDFWRQCWLWESWTELSCTPAPRNLHHQPAHLIRCPSVSFPSCRNHLHSAHGNQALLPCRLRCT